jgi:prolyl-tRNA editing enzyme YbaK/EbsC (Cys-tRNA(Pro) deacylase)
MPSLSPSAQRVQDALRERGLQLKVVELPSSTRTSAEAAAAVGCDVAQIAKSLIFRTCHTDRPVLVIASGANRVNEKRIAELMGEDICKADADYVRQHTGFAIGGVPPVGHLEQIPTFINEDLFRFDEIWAAAGTPHALFRLSPGDLLRATSGKVIVVR